MIQNSENIGSIPIINGLKKFRDLKYRANFVFLEYVNDENIQIYHLVMSNCEFGFDARLW